MTFNSIFARFFGSIGRTGWFVMGCASVALGFIGAFLPLLPTTVFMILAAFCFSKSSPRLEAWLLNSKTFGPMILDWRETGSIAPRYKFVAIFMMGLAFLLSLSIALAPWVLILQACVLVACAIFILTRPNGR